MNILQNLTLEQLRERARLNQLRGIAVSQALKNEIARKEATDTKHTPGPWSLEGDGFSLVMSGQIVSTAIAPDGATIHEQRANARLIAAAPELVAALEALLVSVGSDPFALSAEGRKDFDKARAALAKAKAAA